MPYEKGMPTVLSTSAPGPEPAGMPSGDRDRASQPSASEAFVIGVMKMEVEGRDSERFGAVVVRAVEVLDTALAQETRLRTRTLAFSGAHLTPGAGNYAPLDFLEIGLAEKLERDLPFLLIVTEVDLSSSSLAYTLALPSQLTNIAVLSTRRLAPEFWGDEPDFERTARRLAALMLHCFGHLNALRHASEPSNAMYALEGVQDLDRMTHLDADQRRRIAHTLPREARERSTRDGKLRFVLRMLFEDAGAIVRAVVRANPFRLLAMMPTMLAAALSVIVVLLFSAETWDVASAVSMPQIAAFSVMCLATAAFVLYRAFAFDTLLSRDRRITESGIVTMAAMVLCLVLTLLIMFALFGGLMYVVIITVFPERLMESWPGTERRRRPSTTSSSACSSPRWACSRVRSADVPTAATSSAACSSSPRKPRQDWTARRPRHERRPAVQRKGQRANASFSRFDYRREFMNFRILEEPQHEAVQNSVRNLERRFVGLRDRNAGIAADVEAPERKVARGRRNISLNDALSVGKQDDAR